ncbi:MAG: FAD-dependent oxidoreductase [Candidatus Eisenbacteria bacterium]|uniref:FAD-dependent oxidoreductase n=1 Tax=Eiseniibacteriota bacterium TaxID=2212470 RepID=A0A849SLP3_UNCEI|nr:FAD-dependent oxidoreductase [Candidatus Eisenbacteria bacterium]
MADYEYVIVGGGVAAASALEGIRAHDRDARVLAVSRENHAPYHRPPLSKGLWNGTTSFEQLSVLPDGWYADHGVELRLRREVVELDLEARRVWDDHGASLSYEKLLLATGSRPRRLEVEGAELDGIHYFRQLEDYLRLSDDQQRVDHVLVVGNGFLGLELAAALRQAGREVTLLFADEYPLRRVLPRDLGMRVAEFYREQGIEAVSGETIARFQRVGTELVATTQNRNEVTTQLVVVDLGTQPQTDLADAAGLEVGMGIEVDDHARTTNSHVWAAGEVTEFPCVPLERIMRVEQWDHAREHGRVAGENMAGADLVYDHLPRHDGRLFDREWSAAGDIDASLAVHAVWREPLESGVLFYLREDVVRGVMLWNLPANLDRARAVICAARATSSSEREALALEISD